MLSLSNPLASAIISRLVVAKVIDNHGRKTGSIRSIRIAFEVAATKALIDSFIVGGISFFASLGALGYGDLLVNIKISFISSVTMAGLAFFSELKRQLRS